MESTVRTQNMSVWVGVSLTGRVQGSRHLLHSLPSIPPSTPPFLSNSLPFLPGIFAAVFPPFSFPPASKLASFYIMFQIFIIKAQLLGWQMLNSL